MRRAPLVLASLALVASLAAGCGDDDDAADVSSTTTEATTTTASDGTPTTLAGTDELTSFPQPDAPLAHGGETWAVVLAGAEEDDPSLDAAIQALADVGYETGATSCDQGAAEALGLPAGYVTVSAVGYSTEALATQALTALEERGVEGAVVAKVTTYCLD